jgi:tetratricopeptide (TPR) repeat protein
VRAGTERRFYGLLAGAILLSAAAAYAPSLGYGYVWDAAALVPRNPVIERGGLWRILTSDYWEGTGIPDRSLYRPVTVLSFATERWTLGALRPSISRGVNVVLHALAAFLLGAYVRRGLCESRDTSATAGLVFAAHPLALQSVVNIVGRAEILVTVCTLGALLAVSAAVRGAPGQAVWGRRGAAWGAALLLLLALGSKETALATPLLLIGHLVVAPRPDARAFGGGSRAAVLAPSSVAIVLYGVGRTYALEAFPGLQPVPKMDNVLVGMEGLPRLATSLSMAARYGRLMLWPVGLSGDYSGAAVARESSLVALLPVLGLVMVGGLALLALISVWPRWRGAAGGTTLSMGALLFLLPYLVIGNLLVLTGAGFAERLVYFPSTGFCVLAAWLLMAPSRWEHGRARVLTRRIVLALLAAVIVIAGVHTRRASRMWESDEALMLETLRVTPGSLRAHFTLAATRMSQGKNEQAMELYERALRIDPEQPASLLYKGVLLAQQERFDEAEQALRRSIRSHPMVGETHMNLGLVLARKGRTAEAERALRKALLLDRALVKAAAQLGHLLFQQGRYEEAARYYRGCVTLGRTDLEPNLKAAEARAARAREAGLRLRSRTVLPDEPADVQ